MKLTKYLCDVLRIKGMCQMMEFIHQLIFIKIVLQVVKRFKQIVIKKKGLKKMVIKKRLKKIVIKKIAKRLKKIVIKKTAKKIHVSNKMIFSVVM